jgi:hypothetical protein
VFRRAVHGVCIRVFTLTCSASRWREHNAACWLVNTGWSGGPYGVGKRMKISSHARDDSRDT